MKSSHLRKLPAVVPGLRSPVFRTHNDCHLKHCCVHHVCYHPKKTYTGDETKYEILETAVNIQQNDTSSKLRGR